MSFGYGNQEIQGDPQKCTATLNDFKVGMDEHTAHLQNAKESTEVNFFFFLPYVSLTLSQISKTTSSGKGENKNNKIKRTIPSP